MNKSYRWMFICSIIISVMSVVFATTVFFIKPKDAPSNQTTTPPTTEQQPPAGGGEEPSEPEPKLYEMSADGKYLYFGEYPQSLKEDDVQIVSTYPDSQGYFLGDDGERYYLWNTKYFKVEPLKWRVLTQENGKAFVVCDVVIDSVYYFNYDKYDILHEMNKSYLIDNLTREHLTSKSGELLYANDYNYSNLRSFFNEDFLNKAFSDEKKEIIQQTLVDNSAGQSAYPEQEYTCENQTDYIFALSYAELTSEEFGFNTDYDALDRNRMWGVTDFAVSGYAYLYTYDELDSLVMGEHDNSWFQKMLPCIDTAGSIGLRMNHYNGYHINTLEGCYLGIGTDGPMSEMHVGALPAMWIEL